MSIRGFTLGRRFSLTIIGLMCMVALLFIPVATLPIARAAPVPMALTTVESSIYKVYTVALAPVPRMTKVQVPEASGAPTPMALAISWMTDGFMVMPGAMETRKEVPVNANALGNSFDPYLLEKMIIWKALNTLEVTDYNRACAFSTRRMFLGEHIGALGLGPGPYSHFSADIMVYTTGFEFVPAAKQKNWMFDIDKTTIARKINVNRSTATILKL